MMPEVCLSVDVEDWYDGMEVLGEPTPKPAGARSGLEGLAEHLAARPSTDGPAPRVTLFVVGNYVDTVADELAGLLASGHELASHGPDHGHLPEEYSGLVEWLRSGRCALEDRFQAPVKGFRSPRFDRPASIGLDGFRAAIAEAGFEYVSDIHVLGEASPVRELPVLSFHGFPMGGRKLPAPAARTGGDWIGQEVRGPGGAVLPFVRFRGHPPYDQFHPNARRGQTAPRKEPCGQGVLRSSQPLRQ